MREDFLSERAFYALQWSLVAFAALVVAGTNVLHAAMRSRQASPVKLSQTDYQVALSGTRTVLGAHAKRFSVIEFFDYECHPCRLITPSVRAFVQ